MEAALINSVATINTEVGLVTFLGYMYFFFFLNVELWPHQCLIRSVHTKYRSYKSLIGFSWLF